MVAGWALDREAATDNGIGGIHLWAVRRDTAGPTQAQFLVNCGITEVLGEVNAENALHYAPLAAEA